jgi:hypothetical protein
VNEGPEIERSKLDGRARRFGALRWIPLIVAILIMIGFAMLTVIGRETTIPVGQFPGTPQSPPESHFNPLDPPANRNPNSPHLLKANFCYQMLFDNRQTR